MRINKIKILPKIIISIILITIILGSYVKLNRSNTKAKDKFETSKALIEPYVKELLELHPNWKIEYFDTGLTWSEVIENESVIRRNLVPDAPNLFKVKGADDNESWYLCPTSWKSTTIAGAYNWEQNCWPELCGGGWVQASVEAIEYTMDPRNWITEANVFSFEQLSYNSETQTKAVLKKMMDDTYMDCDYAWVQGSGGKTYAEVLTEAGKKYNVSPVYLCSKLLYEKGTGTYNSTNGKYSMNDTLGSGVATYDGVSFHKAASNETAYYNMFNIQAAGTTTTDVINSGGREAMNAGWTSQYLAIMGGAELIASKYIAIGQTTLYFQKFAVSVEEKYRYWKQYQQAITAAINEGYNNMIAYKNLDMLSSSFSFIVPVYYDMPETVCERPKPLSSVGNPNYKLKSISVTGIDMWNNKEKLLLSPTFNMDRKKYSIAVPFSTTGINISATPIASTTKVAGTGVYELLPGDNTFEIVSKSEYGTKTTYTINVYRTEGSTLLTKLYEDRGKVNVAFDSKITEYETYIYNDETVQFKFSPESDYAKVVLVDADVAFNSKPPNDLKEQQISESGIVHGIYSAVLTKGITPMIYLSEGRNCITIDVYPSETDTNHKTRYTIWVNKSNEVKYSLKKLQTEEEYVSGFEVGDTVKTAISKIIVKNGSISITDSKNRKKTNNAVIGTGDNINILDTNGNVIKTYKIIIYGDVNGDGSIDIFDFAYIRKMLIKKNGLTGIYLMAADIYPESAGIDIYDFAIIRRYIIKGTPIEQKR